MIKFICILKIDDKALNGLVAGLLIHNGFDFKYHASSCSIIVEVYYHKKELFDKLVRYLDITYNIVN